MTPEQHIAEIAQAEMDLAKQKTKDAKLLFRRVFMGLGIFLCFAGVAGFIYVPGWWKFSMIMSLWAGVDLIFSQRLFHRKPEI